MKMKICSVILVLAMVLFMGAGCSKKEEPIEQPAEETAAPAPVEETAAPAPEAVTPTAAPEAAAPTATAPAPGAPAQG